MTTSNRSINTAFNEQERTMTIEVIEDNGKFKKGEVLNVSRSEGRRLVAGHKAYFRIKTY